MSRALTWLEFEQMKHALLVREQVERMSYPWQGENKNERLLTKERKQRKSKSVEVKQV